MHIIEFLGRFFLSTLFLLAGLGKVQNQEGTIAYMEGYGLPGFLLIPAIIIEIFLPILIIIGFKTKLSSLILALFCLLLAIIFHRDFSNPMELNAFLKDFAIAGGFLIIFVYGPNKWSVDYKLNTKKK